MLRLPPLSTLPVLEAVACLQSFSVAAAELNVTQSAMSQQIRSLENHLGVTLFLRIGRGVKLSAGGAAFAEAVRPGLPKIANAAAQLSPQERERKLRISVVPSFSGRWLMTLIRWCVAPSLIAVSCPPSQHNFRAIRCCCKNEICGNAGLRWRGSMFHRPAPVLTTMIQPFLCNRPSTVKVSGYYAVRSCVMRLHREVWYSCLILNLNLPEVIIWCACRKA